MPGYIVYVPEVWIRSIPVDAESEEAAIQKVRKDLESYNKLSDSNFEYSHLLDDRSWDTLELEDGV